ncbi:MAG: imidazole glycerol phosphate synthase subunit HisH [Flavobacteriaceae bacterium]|nr:imidazole glycerol phosphate synthase subunit HisH [Flavobacteriaceae bacterium]MBL6685227.1 imidazole glycerol phosphate synthase subunit HisH [Flavobacteriaceae bacterium]
MNVAIVDYGVGNIKSIQHSLDRIGVNHTYTMAKEEIISADKVIFPGVGDASYAMKQLKNQNLDKLIPNLKQPFLGICLGMQLMCNYSEEGNTSCLGVINTRVKKFNSNNNKIPQIGWNNIKNLKTNLFKGINENEFMYFVHTYFVPKSTYTISESLYGLNYSSAINKDNFYGTQFHPEKSGLIGEKIIKNFISEL